MEIYPIVTHDSMLSKLQLFQTESIDSVQSPQKSQQIIL